MANLALLATKWKGREIAAESTLHQISAYIGRTKPTMAQKLIEGFSKPGDTIFDPFCGSGTIVLEGWLRGRNVVANDLNPYAYVMTKAKLHPNTDYENLLRVIREIAECVDRNKNDVDLRRVPLWVRAFFHPETLRELIIWFQILRKKRNTFLLACLLGILHHQRPGFLSFPASNAVPYLRSIKFPKNEFPEMYDYRDVATRLEKKVKRTLSRVPSPNQQLKRICRLANSVTFRPKDVDVIITSPPYMRRLDYARDNRLRLWFLGITDSRKLDKRISPNETEFLKMMRECLKGWQRLMQSNGRCVLILGDNYSTTYNAPLPQAIESIAVKEVGGYRVESKYTEHIPKISRVRQGYQGNKTETILVLRVRS